MRDNSVKDIVDNIVKEGICDEVFLVQLLKIVRYYNNLSTLEEGYYKELIKILPYLQNVKTKIVLIQTIMQLSDEIDYLEATKLLEMYIELIKKERPEIGEIVNCLSAFHINGYMYNSLFIKVVDNIEENFAIQILVGLGDQDWGMLPLKYNEIKERVQVAWRIKYRSWVLSTFILITCPLCRKYNQISRIQFVYPNIEVAINDWSWIEEGSETYILTNKIVSLKEAQILLELGRMLHTGISVESESINQLYTLFFEGRDPFEVIYTLPT